MEKELLRQYQSIKMEIEDIKKRIEKEKKLLNRIKSESVRVKTGKKSVTVTGKPKEYQTLKTSIQTKILKHNSLREKLEETKEMIEEYIMEIEDSETRRIISFRYIDGLTWQEVAKQMGNGWTSDTCRIKHQRFLDRAENRCSE